MYEDKILANHQFDFIVLTFEKSLKLG